MRKYYKIKNKNIKNTIFITNELTKCNVIISSMAKTNAFDQLMTSKKILESESVDNPETILSTHEESHLLIVPPTSQTIENVTPEQSSMRIIYKFFTKKNSTESMCNTCKKVYKTPSSTTTTLIRHLKSHPTKYSTYFEEKKKAITEFNQHCLKRKHEDNTQQSIQNALKKKSYLTTTSERAMKITKNIGEMITLDYQPYSIVDDRGFKNLLNTLESKYKLPTRQYLSSTVIPQLYSTLVSKIKDEINSDLVYLRSISFTFDIWTSAAQQPYISLTTHYLSKQFKLKNKTLGCSLFSGEHSGKNIFFKIKDMVQEWNIDIVNSDISIFMVTDSVRNMKSAFSNYNENNNLNHFFVQPINYSWPLMMP